MEKLDGRSLDLIKTNIEALKQLFPEVVTEGKIDFDKLKLVLGEEIETRNEKYEFTWHGKTQAMKLAQTPSTGTLRPDKASSKNWETTENLYIEGDNLEVLKLLQKSYFGKIKMIYIDPPYNTGKDFVYKDDFRDNIKNYKEITQQTTKANTETNGRYHTDWLNMMYPRLKLARNLLREDGVIFISIDDNEVANLRKICDEIFGEQNFITQITVLCNPKGRSQDKYFATNHEYILVYSKNDLEQGYFSIQKDEEQIVNDYPEQDEQGRYRLIELRNTHREFGKHNRKNLFYPIYVNPVTSEISLEYKDSYNIKVEPIWDDGYEGCWTWDKSKALEDIHLLVARKTNKGNWKIYRKNYANGAKKMLKTIFLDKLFYTEKGQAVFSSLFSTKSKLFPSPKSVDLIAQLLLTATQNDDIVLDFFSGSATTAHAVMQLNAEDGGNRKFIMVQLPEKTDETSDAYKAGYKNICEIGKERIRRAGEKIVQETGKTDLDIGFKVFKLDSSNIKEWDPDFDNLEQTLFDLQNNIKEDRTKEDLLYEILLKIGLPLTVPIEEIDCRGKTIYNVAYGSVLVCLEDEIDLDLVQEMLNYRSEHMPPKVIFKESGFMSDAVKTNALQTLKKHGITDVRSV
ncbi:DNA methylase N-4 [Geobacillus thermoleovorans]|uniref:Site-specific DNA-methyltransferase n=1 Tax=Geobacillus thermoleovorans TaxID=33941 RepID=A0A2Z3N629_GEOTH|nr:MULTISPECIES: site-specific DNA-methyltransferase [Geobacillus]AMV10621.1 DNA methylase N-4 [Geobacillus thermoleovorans]AWO73149.1 site-specific DNA-methyltransferase [Geobacillus thermoleovorans]EQB94376.1 DNA methylase N-4 [Geobacillus sp. A8]MED3668824.1 site-specific DNA-methyltransferase [Geobacillus kaustophilus]WMJ21230.1 site-specific DNA-methyltransferase [Geobacillus kaustophilus]